MTVLFPNSKGHRVLAYLKDGSATRAELREAVGIIGAKSDGFSRLLRSMRDVGLLRCEPGEGYAITDAGAQLLAGLDRGREARLTPPEGVVCINSDSCDPHLRCPCAVAPTLSRYMPHLES